MARVTKSLKISKDLCKRIKQHCVSQEITIADYIEKLILEDLNNVIEDKEISA